MADHFQITFDAPDGPPLPSISSADIEQGDTEKIKLGAIRARCRVPKKYAFTGDGKNALPDETTLKYYIGLVPEILEKLSAKDSEENPVDTKIAKPVKTIAIKLVSTSPTKASRGNLAQSSIQSDLKNLLEAIKKDGDSKRLDDISGRLLDMTAKPESFSVNPGGDYTEAEDLTESQWENILVNNRALNGYTFDIAQGVLVKAPKRAFAIRRPRPLDITGPDSSNPAKVPSGPASPAKNAGLATVKGAPKKQNDASSVSPGVKEYLKTVPGIPPFYVYDDSSVTVTEIQTAFQHRMAEDSFSSEVIEANIAGAAFGAAASASAAWSQENQRSQQKIDAESTTALQVSYSFPRVVLNLPSAALQLSDECYQDAISIKSEEMAKDFLLKYGKAFPTQVTLGGVLRSKHLVKKMTRDSLDERKEQIKWAAGASFSTPKASANANYANTNSNTKADENHSASLSSQITWEAKGGDTVLCSNPPAWASTVKNYRYWRIIKQSQIVSLTALIRSIDSSVADHIDFPNENKDGHPSTEVLLSKVQEIIKNGKEGIPYKTIRNYYETRPGLLPEYNKQVPDKTLGPIVEGTEWDKLTENQKVFYGVFLVQKGAPGIVS